MVLNEFPALAQTYIRSEINALRPDFDISVIRLRPSPLTYETDIVHRRMRRESSMIRRIRRLRPDILHTHFVMFAPLLDRLSAATGIPFTVRSHSFDVFGYLRDRTAHWSDGVTVHEVVSALNSPRCRGVLAFPFMRGWFEESGVDPAKVHDCFPVIDFDAFYDRSPNGPGVVNLGVALSEKHMESYVRLADAVPEQTFDLYAVNGRVRQVRRFNRRLSSPVRMHAAVDPSRMPPIYKSHTWLVYTASFEENRVGWPMAVAEAQASGVGVCAPNLRPDMKEYVGDGGVLYDDVLDVREIVSGPVPKEMREAGFELARRSDARGHIATLTDLW